MTYPIDCYLCVRAKTNSNMFSGDVQLPLRPIRGTNPSVMITGQDPTIAKRQDYSVLDLENKSKYLDVNILSPVGLKLDNIYATDLVKCRFPDKQTPKKISQKNKIKIKNFLDPFFYNCRHWFRQEVNEIHPKILLALGEPVHQLLIEEFSWDVPKGMKDAFGNIYKIDLLGDNALYVPCIHINSRRNSYYKKLWPKFIWNLKHAMISVGIA